MEVQSLSDQKSFRGVSDSAKLWVFMSSRELSSSQEQIISNELTEMLTHWKSHGAQVQGGFLILYKKFILVVGQLEHDGVSGCGIDSMVRSMKEISNRAGFTLSEHQNIFFKKDGNVIEVTKDAYRELVKNKEVGPETIVFNTAIQTVGELRNGKFELMSKDSWHGKRFSA